MSDRFDFLEMPGEHNLEEKSPEFGDGTEALLKDYLSQAQDVFFSGDFVKCLRAISRVLEEDPLNMNAWKLKILAAISTNDLDGARKIYTNALIQFEELQIELEVIGLFLAERDMKQTMFKVSKLKEMMYSPFVDWIRIMIHIRNQKISQRKLKKQIAEVHWEEAQSFHILAGIHSLLHARDFGAADLFLQVLLDSSEDNFYLYYLRAWICYRMARIKPADNFVKIALSLNPYFQPARDLDAMINRVDFIERIGRQVKRFWPWSK